MRRSSAVTGLLAVVALGVAVAPAAAAEPAPRTASVSGGLDPQLAYDLAAAQVALDPASGTLSVAIDLHAALPTPLPGDDRAVTVTLAAAAEPRSGDPDDTRCRPTAPGLTDGDATVRLAAAAPLDPIPELPAERGEGGEQPAPELAATATVAPDPLPRTLPATLSADRRRLEATIVDPLLDGAAPSCLVVRSSGLADELPSNLPADEPADEELSVWFDGQQPPRPPDPPSDPRAQPTPPPPAMPAPGSGGVVVDSPRSPGACPQPAGLTWGAFPRELAVRGTALVPVQARRGRDVREVVATLTTFVRGRRVGPPVQIALPPRGYALKLQAPPQPGRLDAQLAWQERRGEIVCQARSRSFRIAVVAPRAPRLTVGGTARRLTLSWGLPGRDCHALLAHRLRVRLAGMGQQRDYRVAASCAGWDEPGAALPDIAVQRDAERLTLAPLGDEPGLWEYRLSAVVNGRTVLSGTLLVEIAEGRDGALVRTIRLRRG